MVLALFGLSLCFAVFGARRVILSASNRSEDPSDWKGICQRRILIGLFGNFYLISALMVFGVAGFISDNTTEFLLAFLGALFGPILFCLPLAGLATWVCERAGPEKAWASLKRLTIQLVLGYLALVTLGHLLFSGGF